MNDLQDSIRQAMGSYCYRNPDYLQITILSANNCRKSCHIYV